MIAQSLKKSILQEAISGRLVPQIESEGTAEDILREIAKQQKKNFAFSEIPEDEQPFAIPSSWKWVRLGEIFEHNTGKTMNSSSNTKNTKGVIMKFITTSNVYWNNFDFTNVKEMFFSDAELDRNTIKKGDLIVCEGGAYYGRTAIWDYDYAIGFQNHLHRLRSFVPMENKYFYYAMYLYKNTGRIECVGAAMPALSSKALHIIPIPLPPLAEQVRIVEKLETLLPKIDSLEKTETRLSLLESTLGERLWKSVLQEAISGRLTTRQPSDGTADDLLEQIKAAHREAFATTQKKYKPLTFSPIPDSEIPFEIPENWKWVRLGEIGDWGSGSTPDRTNPTFYNGNVIWIKTGELNNSIVYDSEEKISDEALRKGSFKINKVGDVMIAMYGATIGKLGIAGKEMVTNQACCGCTLYGGINNKYLFYYLMANKDRFIKMGAGGAQPNISRTKIIAYPFPLPPLSEQLRIVTKLEKLRSALDKRG